MLQLPQTLFTNEHDNCFPDNTKKCVFSLYFRNIFPIQFHDGHMALLFTVQSKIPKWLLSNSKAVNTREDKKRRQSGLVLK